MKTLFNNKLLIGMVVQIGLLFWINCLQAFDIISNNAKSTASEKSSCSSVLSTDLNLHIPEVNFNNTIYWLDLRYEPTQDGSILLKSSGFGQVAQANCGSDSAFLIPKNGKYLLAIPELEYSGSLFQVQLEYSPSSDGRLWFKLITYDQETDWDGEGLAFFSSADSELISSTNRELKFQETFPTEGNAEMTIGLIPQATSSPSKFSYSADNADHYEYSLSYSVPYSKLPTEVVELLSTSSKTAKSVDTSLGILVTGKLPKKATKAWETSKRFKELMKELDRIEECTENPPIEITPEQIKQINEAIKEAREAIKVGTGARAVHRGARASTIKKALTEKLWLILEDYLTPLTKDALDGSIKGVTERLDQLLTCNQEWSGTVTLQATTSVPPTWSANAKVTFIASPESPKPGITRYYIKEGTLSWKIQSPYTFGTCSFSFTPAAGFVILDPSDGYLDINHQTNTYRAHGYLIEFESGKVTACCPGKGGVSCGDGPSPYHSRFGLWFATGDVDRPIASNGKSIIDKFPLDRGPETLVFDWTLIRKN